MRRNFGVEVLDHSPDSVRLSRLNAGAPVLWNHNGERQDHHLGIVESAEIGADRRGYAVIRLGRSAEAERALQDIEDGILRNVSVGYALHDRPQPEKGEGGANVFRFKDWEPHEISLTPIPADTAVGVGREFEPPEPLPEQTEVKPAATAATTERGARVMAEEKQQPSAAEIEIARRDGLMRLASDEQFSKHVSTKQVREAIDGNTSVADFSEAISRSIIAQNKVTEVGTAGADVMTEVGKDAKRYSILRAQRLALHQANGRLYASEDFKLEREVSDEIKKRTGLTSSPNVVMPTEAVRVQTAVASATGQNPVGTVVAPTTTNPNVIPMFRVQPKVLALGATHLGGLNGILKMPRQTASGTAYWLAETVDTPESDIALDYFTMSPKRLGIQNQFTVELLAQDAVGVENLLSTDRDKVIALAVDNAALLPGGNGVPVGLLGQTGLAMVTSTGTALTNGNAMSYNDFLTMEEIPEDANAAIGGNFAWLTTPGVRRLAKATPMLPGSITGPIWPTSSRNPAGTEEGPLGYTAAVSNQVPKNFGTAPKNNLHAVIFGDWSNILIGDWGASELIVDPYTKAGQAIYVITERLLMDVGVRHIAPFVICETAAVS